jgi:PAS domain-containing protein
LWLAFALRYTRRTGRLNWATRLLFTLPGLIAFVLSLTSQQDPLVWQMPGLQAGSPALVYTPGVAYLESLAAQYLFVLAAVVVFVQAYPQAASVYRPQFGLMIAGALVPLGANALSLVGLHPVRGLDLMPYGFMFSAVLLAAGLFSLGLLDVQPVAARAVFDHLRDAVLVLDRSDRLIDHNPAARRLFDLDDSAVGQLAPPAVREAGGEGAEFAVMRDGVRRWHRLESSPLVDPYQRPIGRVVLLRDVTDEHTLQQLREDLTHMLVHDLNNPSRRCRWRSS